MTREEIGGWAAEQAETWKEQAAEEARERGGGSGLAYATEHHAYFDAIAAELRKTCEWKADDDGIFQTGCGHSFYFDGAGGPTEHQQKFCGYCGGSLIEVKP